VFVDIYTNKKVIIFDSLGYFRTLSSNSFSNAQKFPSGNQGIFKFLIFLILRKKLGGDGLAKFGYPVL